MNRPIILYSTAPDNQTADKIARALVESGAAACVNIIPAITSVYRWEGKVQSAPECALLIKTTKAAAARARETLAAIHPYDTPALIALEINENDSSRAFCDWIRTESIS